MGEDPSSVAWMSGSPAYTQSIRHTLVNEEPSALQDASRWKFMHTAFLRHKGCASICVCLPSTDVSGVRFVIRQADQRD